MKIKTVFNEDIRVHSFDSEDGVTIDALSGVISKCYLIEKPFSLTYEDSDGDIVTVQSDEDLKFAIEDARKVLKIRVNKEATPKKAAPEVTVKVVDENAPDSDDEEEFEIEEQKVEPKEKVAAPVEEPQQQEGPEEPEPEPEPEGNVYEIYCDDLLDNEELQKEIAATIKFALSRLRSGDNILTAIETALAHHEMVANHPLVQKVLPKLPCFAQKAAVWAPIAANIQDAQVDMFFQMILAKLRALRDGPSEYPDFSFLQRHPFLGHIFSQLDVYTEPGENGGSDVHVAAKQKEVTHRRVACDECNAEPITGARFKCTVCPNYDLCENCESENKHDPTHPLIKMNVPLGESPLGKPAGLREFSRQAGGGCGRGRWRAWRGGRGRGGRCGRGWGRRQWMMHQQQQQQNSENQETPLNPEAAPFNPFALFGKHMFSGRGRGGRCGRRGGRCHGKGKEGKDFKGKKHWRQEKKNKGPLEYDAKMIRHMNLEDDTPVGQGILFKTWRVKNNGLKTWNKSEVAVVYEGKPFHQLVDGAKFDIAGPVEPGQEVDVSVVLNVPEGFSGDALVKYRLKCGDIKFGPPLKVKIRVVGDEITEIQKVKKFGKHGGKGNEKKLQKAEKQLERLENQKNKLEHRAEKVAAKIEKLKSEEEEKEKAEPLKPAEPEQEPEQEPEPEPLPTPEPVEESNSSSFEVVTVSDDENDDDDEAQKTKGYSFRDFTEGWSKRHLRQTSMESVKRAFLGLKPNEDGVVEADVVQKFYEEFSRLNVKVEDDDDNDDEEESKEEQPVENEPVLVEEEAEKPKPEAEIEPEPKKEFVEPKAFPYQDQLEHLTDMGFNEDLVRPMLEKNGGNVQAVITEIWG